jgi:hypothetical protein
MKTFCRVIATGHLVLSVCTDRLSFCSSCRVMRTALSCVYCTALVLWTGGCRVSTEVDFWIRESRIFPESVYISVEFHGIPCAKFRGKNYTEFRKKYRYYIETNSEKVTVFYLQWWALLLLVTRFAASSVMDWAGLLWLLQWTEAFAVTCVTHWTVCCVLCSERSYLLWLVWWNQLLAEACALCSVLSGLLWPVH